MAPINMLLQASVLWNQGPEKHKGFEEIKKILTNCPCLTMYDTNWEMINLYDESLQSL